jgi:hypothetical protein
MPRFVIAGDSFQLESVEIEGLTDAMLAEPLREHYVVVGGRRFPPKQVISCATGVDRADFTTHQARRILRRLGFVTARVSQQQDESGSDHAGGDGPHGGRQAAALRPHVGKWVAMAGPTDVLVAADTPEEVIAWLARHGRQASYGMFRVPASEADSVGVAPL